MFGVWRCHYRAHELNNAAENWHDSKARTRGPFFAWLKTLQGFNLEARSAHTEVISVPQ